MLFVDAQTSKAHIHHGYETYKRLGRSRVALRNALLSMGAFAGAKCLLTFLTPDYEDSIPVRVYDNLRLAQLVSLLEDW
jgi:hypothetical protein